MEAHCILEDVARTAGGSSCTSTTSSATHKLIHQPADSKTIKSSSNTLNFLGIENDIPKSSWTPYSRISNISLLQTHKRLKRSHSNEVKSESNALASSNLSMYPDAGIEATIIENTGERTSHRRRVGNKESRISSNFRSRGHKLVSSKIEVPPLKRGSEEQQHCFNCLCRGLLTTAFSSCSLFSSAMCLTSTSQQQSSRKSPPLTRRSSTHGILLMLSLFLCAFDAANSARTVTRSSASNSNPCSLPFTGDESKAILADVVIEGKVRKALAADPKTGLFDHYVSIRKKIIKGERIVKDLMLVAGRGNKTTKRLRIGPFRNRKTDAKSGNAYTNSCVASVQKGRTYFFFLKNIGRLKGLQFQLMAMPSRRTKKLAQTLHDILRKAKAPSIRYARGLPQEVIVGNRLLLKCNARGRPNPRFEWYKDGEKIQTRKGLVIKGKRRTTKLIIKRAKEEDKGIYTCAAENAVGRDSKNITVSVRLKRLPGAYLRQAPTGSPPTTRTSITTRRVSGQKSYECEKQTYCLNGGTCMHIPKLRMDICKCTERWSGRRCELLDGLSVRVDYFRQSTLLYERTLIIIGIVIAALVFIVICIASYILAKGRRKRFEQRKRSREALRAARNQDATAANAQVNHQTNDVSVRESPLRSAVLAAADGNITTPLQSNNALPPNHEIHPLLLKQQLRKQEQQLQQQQRQQQQLEEDDPDPQLQALLRSCDPNHQSRTEGHGNGERTDARKRLTALSQEDSDAVPSTFTACTDRRETTTAAVLHAAEDIEMNNMESNGKERDRNSSPNAGNSGIEEDMDREFDPNKEDVQASLPSVVHSPPSISSPTSSTYSARPPSTGSVSPPPYHRAVYIPSPSHPQAGEEDPNEEETATIPLLASDQARDKKEDTVPNDGTNKSAVDPKQNLLYKRTSFQKNHAPPLNNVRDWNSAPTPGNNKANDSQIYPHKDDAEREYDSDEDMVTERDNLLGRSSQSSPPQNRKNKSQHVPSIFPPAPSVSHSNTFPKPSRVNGIVRGSSTSHNAYPNSEDESSSSDESDAPREFPYQKQRDDLYISEDDLGLSKENLASTSFSSGGRMSRQLSRQESRDMEEPVVGLLPSQNLKPPRDQLRKYPSEEGPAYSILACKAQGLHLQDDNRSKSLDDPMVCATMAESSTNATASASSLSTSPYGSSSPLVSSASLNGNPHSNSYHYPGQHPRQVNQPVFEGGSRLHSTLAGSPMVETYGENDERFGLNAIHNQNSYRSRPSAYDPNEDGKPWDKETSTTRQDKSKDFALQRSSVERDNNEEERDRLQRLKDVYPDQTAIPI